MRSRYFTWTTAIRRSRGSRIVRTSDRALAAARPSPVRSLWTQEGCRSFGKPGKRTLTDPLNLIDMAGIFPTARKVALRLTTIIARIAQALQTHPPQSGDRWPAAWAAPPPLSLAAEPSLAAQPAHGS